MAGRTGRPSRCRSRSKLTGGPMEASPEPDPAALDSPVATGRVRRAFTLIVISACVMGAAGVAYLHPSLGAAAGPGMVAPGSTFPSDYQLAAIDFVAPTEGWVLAVFDDGGYL